MPKIVRFWLPVFILSAIIFFFSSRPTSVSVEIYWQDFILKKSAHVVLYSSLFVLVYRALINTRNISKKQAALIAISYVALYGISDEFHQSFTPGRGPSLRDVMIDILAGGLAWLTIWKYLPKAPKKVMTLGKALQIT